ncbi:MAG: chloride channel protein [Myxococcaceae bacterium]|nr:chloride channel protein [Myxococcaceae bacterium]
MTPPEGERIGSQGALPVAPSIEPTLALAHVAPPAALVDARVVLLSLLSVLLALAAGVIASLLTKLIGLCTNLAFYGRFATSFVSPAQHRLGAWVIGVPVLGGLLVGLMARYGAKAIRGHGIPEAMEQVLTKQSRIPARMTFLKPLSAAISIGTGGPFGAEGPIIATGGALGSLLGQLIHTSDSERKTLLAAGAAAGMAATFGSPVSAVLLAVELLLFEYRPRSLIPVALAATVAAAVHASLTGGAAVFLLPELAPPSSAALASYVLIGALVGVASVGVTRAVYAVEDAFEKLPVHWMWWPALGGLVVGLVGYVAPRTMGVGYDNIEQILAGQMLPAGMLVLCSLKFVSWAVSLGSGTSGGTLAPLFTLGGGLGALLGTLLSSGFPGLGVDPRIAALVGMAALFAGASRALLASVVFAFETTRQPLGLLPLLGGCSAAFLVSCLLMKNSIMTEKIARRGIKVQGEYTTDFLQQLRLREHALRSVVTLRADDTIAAVRSWLEAGSPGSEHQGFPVLDQAGTLVGVVTRKDVYRCSAARLRLRDLLHRPCFALHDEQSFRDAADLMARERIGRLPVLSRSQPGKLVGIVTRSDLVDAHVARLSAQERRSSRARAA